MANQVGIKQVAITNIDSYLILQQLIILLLWYYDHRKMSNECKKHSTVKTKSRKKA